MTAGPQEDPSRSWTRRVHLAAFLAFLLAWTIALLSPVPRETAREFLIDDEGIFYFGKLLHVAVYGFLMVLGGTLWLMRGRWSWLVVFLILHGELTEYFQQFVGRFTSVRDALLDAAGVLIGAGIVWKWWMRKGERRE